MAIALKQIKSYLRKELLQQLILGLFLLIVGVGLVWLSFSRDTVWTVLGLVSVGVGVRLIYLGRDYRRVEQTPLGRILLQKPEQIVWVYSIVTQRMPFGVEIMNNGLMYFNLIDGRVLTLSLPRSLLRPLSEQLNVYLPQATFGYTQDREQWFVANPELLLRDTDVRNDME